jgi:hypothetical protein
MPPTVHYINGKKANQSDQQLGRRWKQKYSMDKNKIRAKI